jgi:hypothetical protein
VGSPRKLDRTELGASNDSDHGVGFDRSSLLNVGNSLSAQ